MIKSTYILLLIFSFSLYSIKTNANETDVKGEQNISIPLKYIIGSDVISVLESLIDKSVSISEKNNVLLVNGEKKKIKNILHIVKQIDTPPTPLTIEFIASSKKIDFKQTYQPKNLSSQSMSITERQWVTLNTGLSIPVSQRQRYADGTETQSFKYVKISKSYVFKVHEFSGWSVIQVGANDSSSNNDIASIIEDTTLDTTIVGKTGEWLEVSSSKTDSENKNQIYLYVKIRTPEIINETKIIK